MRFIATLSAELSIAVAGRMFLVPSPGGLDDVFQRWILRLPAEFGERLVRGGHELRRVTGTTRLFNRRDFLARDLLAHLNDFLHRIAVAVAEIEETALSGLQAENVRLRQILDVNIITDAGAVGRGVIRAVNLHLRLLAERHEQHVRDEMRLDAVMLAEFFARAGSVEITERNEFQSVNLLIPQQRLLEHQLGFAVGIDRTLRQIFRHRHAVWRTVSGASRAEDEFLHATFHGGVRQLERVDEVVVEILFGVRHGLADERERGKMKAGVWLHRLDGSEDVSLFFR